MEFRSPVHYNDYQLTMFHQYIQPMLNKIANDFFNFKCSHERFGETCNVSFNDSDWFHLHNMINGICASAYKEFGLYIISVSEACALQKDNCSDYYMLGTREDEIRLAMMEEDEDSDVDYGYKSFPQLTNKNCKYYKYLASDGE